MTASPSRGYLELASRRNSLNAERVAHTYTTETITTGDMSRSRAALIAQQETDGLRDLHACMDYQFAAPSLRDRTAALNSAQAHSIGRRGTLLLYQPSTRLLRISLEYSCDREFSFVRT